MHAPVDNPSTASLSADAKAKLARTHEVILALVGGSAPDLPARQWALLLTVYLEEPPHGVGHLAARLQVPKPATSRALDALERLDLVARGRDPLDRRGVIVRRTAQGAALVGKLAALVAGEGGVNRARVVSPAKLAGRTA